MLRRLYALFSTAVLIILAIGTVGFAGYVMQQEKTPPLQRTHHADLTPGQPVVRTVAPVSLKGLAPRERIAPYRPDVQFPSSYAHGGAHVSPHDGSFAFSGGTIQDGADGFVTLDQAVPARGGPDPYSALFRVDGSSMDVWLRSASGSYQLFMNDKPVGPPRQVPRAAKRYRTDRIGTTYYRLHVQFGATVRGAPVELLLVGAAFGGVTVQVPDGRVGALGNPFRFRAAVLGDDYAQGYGGLAPFTGCIYQTARRLGWDPWINAIHATGYQRVHGSDPGLTFQDRFESDVRKWAPQVLLLVGGGVDREYDADSERSAVASLIRAASQIDPSPQIVVVGPLWPTSRVPADIRAVDRAMREAAGAAGVPFIDPIAEHWITGVRSKGTGNAAGFIGADNVHPNQAGYNYLTRLLVHDLRRITSLPVGPSHVLPVPHPAVSPYVPPKPSPSPSPSSASPSATPSTASASPTPSP